MAENFDLIFGQNASQQYAWNDADYQNGWETIGNIPPTAAQFDALQRRNDTKAQELNNALTPLVNANQTDNRQPSTAYSEGNIKYSPLLPTGWFLACTVSGMSSASELVVPSPVEEGDEITDGGVTWKIKKIGGAGNAGDGVPLGAIIAYSANGDIPSGYLLCDGAAVSRTMYPDLFSVIGTTYGAGDGSTTFNLPEYTGGTFPEGSTTAGMPKSAGLPNIKGTFSLGEAHAKLVGLYSIDGAFYGTNSGVITNPTGGGDVGGDKNRDIHFDASLSNPIYSDSATTVQPKSLTTRFIIKAFDGQTADSALIDVTQYANELAGKADRALDNLSADGENHFLENGFTIIYPNGGSEASPANVTTNSRYVESNPFPGYRVNCVAEIELNNQWCDSGFIYSVGGGGGYGVKATHLMPDDNVIVQVGSVGVVTVSRDSGNGFNITKAGIKTAPCRVKVWKIGKIHT